MNHSPLANTLKFPLSLCLALLSGLCIGIGSIKLSLKLLQLCTKGR